MSLCLRQIVPLCLRHKVSLCLRPKSVSLSQTKSVSLYIINEQIHFFLSDSIYLIINYCLILRPGFSQKLLGRFLWDFSFSLSWYISAVFHSSMARKPKGRGKSCVAAPLRVLYNTWFPCFCNIDYFGNIWRTEHCSVAVPFVLCHASKCSQFGNW